MKVVRIRNMLPETEIIPEQVDEDSFEQASEADQPAQEERKPRAKISAKDQQILKEKLSRFTGCGRCSLFLAAYRLDHDDAEMLTAVNGIENGWIELPWDQNLRELINKSYGCRIDIESYYFESCCPECHNIFIYSETEDSEHYTLRFKM